ncbi:hypothetical protein N836_31280 [Leptolyngbya sp. Heron Island J]|nr:hypothetical protein N836_31280 [Leptolyngbya sp. Heron Island J]
MKDEDGRVKNFDFVVGALHVTPLQRLVGIDG